MAGEHTLGMPTRDDVVREIAAMQRDLATWRATEEDLSLTPLRRAISWWFRRGLRRDIRDTEALVLAFRGLLEFLEARERGDRARLEALRPRLLALRDRLEAGGR